MKRLIDVLTLVTMALAVLATAWSIDLFGQVGNSPKGARLSQEMDQFLISCCTEISHPDAVEIGAKQQIQAIEIKKQPECKTFEFMGDQYYSDPEANYVDSCMIKKANPNGYFRFMGDNYPSLPEEQGTLDITF